MDREISSDERDGVQEKAQDHRPGRGSVPREILEKPALSRDREATTGRGRTHQISEAERATLRDIGRFRTVAEDDLRDARYGGSADPMRQDLRSLVSQGLVRRRTVWVGGGRGKLAVLVLSREGKAVCEQDARGPTDQAYYAGFVKPGEVAHDAAIYRMYQAEANQIQEQGGRIQRVVLDYELKKKVYSPLAKVRSLPPLDYARCQAEVARENGLKVVEGRIRLPDLRIEYETSQGDLTHVDLELATHHYRGSQIGAKAEAGFKIYAPSASVGRLSAALEEREITAEILSL